MNEEEKKDLDRRHKEDFDFMVTCHAKGNPAMYALLRDRSLDKKEMTPSEKGELEYSSWF